MLVPEFQRRTEARIANSQQDHTLLRIMNEDEMDHFPEPALTEGKPVIIEPE
jgi:hypothetical protein